MEYQPIIYILCFLLAFLAEWLWMINLQIWCVQHDYKTKILFLTKLWCILIWACNKKKSFSKNKKRKVMCISCIRIGEHVIVPGRHSWLRSPSTPYASFGFWSCWSMLDGLGFVCFLLHHATVTLCGQMESKVICLGLICHLVMSQLIQEWKPISYSVIENAIAIEFHLCKS